MARIVSLVPSVSELLATVGLGSQLVGRSHRCLQPDSLARVPALTAPKERGLYGPELPDDSPESALSHCLADDFVLLEALKDAKPDYLITRFATAGTAHTTESLKRLVGQHLGANLNLELVEGTDFQPLLNDLQRIADTFGAGAKAKKLFDAMHVRMEQIYEQAKNAPKRRRVLVLSSLAPLVAAGEWVPHLLESCYLEPVLLTQAQPSRRITWKQVIAADPDAIVLALAEKPRAEAEEELEDLHTLPEMRTLRAYRNRQLFVVEGLKRLLPGGLAFLESCEVLAEMAYPELFGRKRLGHGWFEAV